MCNTDEKKEVTISIVKSFDLIRSEHKIYILQFDTITQVQKQIKFAQLIFEWYDTYYIQQRVNFVLHEYLQTQYNII